MRTSSCSLQTLWSRLSPWHRLSPTRDRAAAAAGPRAGGNPTGTHANAALGSVTFSHTSTGPRAAIVAASSCFSMQGIKYMALCRARQPHIVYSRFSFAIQRGVTTQLMARHIGTLTFDLTFDCLIVSAPLCGDIFVNCLHVFDVICIHFLRSVIWMVTPHVSR